MNNPSIQAGLQQELAIQADRQEALVVVSAQDARKLLSMPGATSFRQGAVRIVVDAKGQQYIVRDLDAQAPGPDGSEPQDQAEVSRPQASSDEADDTDAWAGQQAPDEAPADMQVAAASAAMVPATPTEAHMAQAPAGSGQPEAKSEDQACKNNSNENDEDITRTGLVM